MSNLTTNEPVPTQESFLRKSQLTGLLELICRELELTESQQEKAREHYDAVSKWLADAPALEASSIYPQGSLALGTTVKPIGRDEFDVDLVCLNSQTKAETEPAELKKELGDRLREHKAYAPILEEKPRCWRLNYAGDFHLDITPSVPNPACNQGGELVPDKKVQSWKASNPKGYRRWFEARAALRPTIRLQEVTFAEARAEVEALPGPVAFKGPLKRAVQLFKRHRDTMFSESKREKLAPISIILTTLAATSYKHCVNAHIYDTELDLVLDVLRMMPSFIEVSESDGREHYVVPNETTEGENFAEKWNEDNRLATAFYEWHEKALTHLEKMLSVHGMDHVQHELSVSFGEAVAGRAVLEFTEAVEKGRKDGALSVTPGVGLAIGAAKGVSVRKNTFFGQ